MSFYHDQACGDHFGARKTATKVLQCGFYWPNLFRDAYEYYKSYVRCQQIGWMTKRDMMSINPILIVEIFDVWELTLWDRFQNLLEMSTFL